MLLLEVIVAVRQPRRPGQVVAHEAQHTPTTSGGTWYARKSSGRSFFSSPRRRWRRRRSDAMTAFSRSPQLRQYVSPQPGRRSFTPPQRQQISPETLCRIGL